VVDKPPNTAAAPPHRIKVEAAAMEASLDTFSTVVGVPNSVWYLLMSQEKVVFVLERVVRANWGCGLLRIVVVGRPYSLPLTRSSTTTRMTGSDPAPSREVPFPHITVVASSSTGVCASLK
jgi:hypothetical protein